MNIKSKELRVAIKAARKAGAYVRKQQDKVIIEKTKSNWKDLLTKNDIESEKIILETLQSIFPEDRFITEEAHAAESPSKRTWVIDPIDGTTNYVSGLPFYAISIALITDNGPRVGVVYAPLLKKMYTAERGKGAFCNNKRITLRKTQHLNEAVIAFGFNYFKDAKLKAWIEKYAPLINAVRDARRFGSAALDCCLVAEGTLSAYVEPALKPWDIAAGKLIIEETGAKLTDEEGNPVEMFRRVEGKYECKPIIASTGEPIHAEIQAILAKEKITS